MKRKFIVPIMIAAMTAGSIPAFGANFYDINDVPWEGAKTYINDVADLGLMVGDTDSQGRKIFRAKDNLGYLESCQLVFAIFGNTKGLTAYTDTIGTKWSSVMKGYKISDWAYKPVSFCLENGIVTISDVSGFMNGTKVRNAAKQDVAVMFGKAMEKAGYTQTKAVSFNDASKIAASALKYANLLGSHGIFVGDEKQNFNPTKLINRAEMAVIVSKTHNIVKGNAGTTTPQTPTGSGSLTGIVSSVVTYGNQYLITMLANEGPKSFLTSTNVTVTFDGKNYTPADIEQNDTITVMYSGTTVSSVVITKDADGDIEDGSTTSQYETASTYSGTIASMNSSRIKVAKDSKNDETFTKFVDDLQVIIDGRSRTYSRLEDEYDDASRTKDIKVTIHLNEDDEVFKIVATIEGDEASGDIDSASSTRIKLDGDTYYFNDDEDLVTIKINGYSVTIDEFVKAYDEYKDFYADAILDGEGKIISLDVESADYEGSAVKGYVDSISSTRIKVDGTWYNFPTDVADMRIKLNGNTVDLDRLDDAFDDLYGDEAMYVEITLDNNKVDKITAKTEVETEEITGEIKDVSSDEIKIGSKTYDVDDYEITVDIENGSSDIDDYDELKSFISDLDRERLYYSIEVEATVEDGYVTELKGYTASITDALVLSASYSNDTVTFDIAGTSYRYKVDSDCTIKEEGSTRDLDDLDNDAYDHTVYATVTIDKYGEITRLDYFID